MPRMVLNFLTRLTNKDPSRIMHFAKDSGKKKSHEQFEIMSGLEKQRL